MDYFQIIYENKSFSFVTKNLCYISYLINGTCLTCRQESYLHVTKLDCNLAKDHMDDPKEGWENVKRSEKTQMDDIFATCLVWWGRMLICTPVTLSCVEHGGEYTLSVNETGRQIHIKKRINGVMCSEILGRHLPLSVREFQTQWLSPHLKSVENFLRELKVCFPAAASKHYSS